jgi:uncharacterized protein (TIGR04255 family)
MELKLGGHEITTRPLNLRTEIREESVIHIVQIVSPAEAAVPGESKRLAGVLLDIDTIHPMKENESWGEVEVSLDHAHSAAKRIFFSLLTNETVEKLEPEY